MNAVLSDSPPFTADQLDALTAGDDFEGVDIGATYCFEPTSFQLGLNETLRDMR